MRKTLLLLAIALCSMAGTQAKEISESEAARIASEFVSSHGSNLTRSDVKLTLAKSSQGYYAYNRGAGTGFVVVAADDAMGAQVLGYSANGSLDFDQLPCNLKWWLAQYDLMAATGASFPQASATRAEAKAAIEPLITCQWNQYSPYNDLCPEYIEGIRCATGCVATATAQVMYYHKWPENGTGSNFCTWKGQTLSMDFSEHTYDWASMTDTYDENSSVASKEAVALLMRDCGYAMNMQYSYVSSTSTSASPLALINHFGYDRSISQIGRYYYAYDEWNDMLYAELAAKRPILVCGGSHAFVFDGYKQEDGNDWYHVNWGWGGLSDGYFLCSDLTPNAIGAGATSGSFNQSLIATIGIQPAIEGSESVPVLYCTPFEPTTVKNGSDVTFETTLLNYSIVDTAFTFGLKVINESTKKTTYVKNDTASTFTFYFEGIKMSLKDFPTNEGTYDVYPVYFVGDKEYNMRTNICMPSFSKAEVKGDSISFTYGEDFVHLNVSDVTVSSKDPIYTYSTVNVSAVVKSENKDYCGNLYMRLVKDYNSPNSIISSSAAVAIDLRKGESVNATFKTAAPSEADTYYIIFVDRNGIVANSTPMPITIAALPEGELKLESSVTIGKATDYDPANEDLDVKLSIKCTSGYYIGDIFLTYTEQGQEETPVQDWYKYIMIIEGDAPLESEFTYSAGDLAHLLEYGKTYIVSLGYVDSDEKLVVLPSDVTLTTVNSSGISDVTTSGEPQSIKIYSLDGNLVATQKAVKPDLSTLPAGTYIVKIGNKAQKMVSGK